MQMMKEDEHVSTGSFQAAYRRREMLDVRWQARGREVESLVVEVISEKEKSF